MTADNRLHTKKNPGGRTRRLTGKPSILFSKAEKPFCDQIGGNLNQKRRYSLVHIHHPLSVLFRTLNCTFFISKKQIHHTTIIKQILDTFEFRKLLKTVFLYSLNLEKILLEWNF